MRIPVLGQSYIEYTSYLVDVNVPMLFLLPDQRRFKCVTSKDDSGPEHLLFRTASLSLPLTLQFGHLYYNPCPNEHDIVLFTSSELAQVHRNMGHAAAAAACSALRRMYPSKPPTPV